MIAVGKVSSAHGSIAGAHAAPAGVPRGIAKVSGPRFQVRPRCARRRAGEGIVVGLPSARQRARRRHVGHPRGERPSSTAGNGHRCRWCAAFGGGSFQARPARGDGLRGRSPMPESRGRAAGGVLTLSRAANTPRRRGPSSNRGRPTAVERATVRRNPRCAVRTPPSEPRAVIRITADRFTTPIPPRLPGGPSPWMLASKPRHLVDSHSVDGAAALAPRGRSPPSHSKCGSSCTRHPTAVPARSSTSTKP